jgi:hypothetical protein
MCLIRLLCIPHFFDDREGSYSSKGNYIRGPLAVFTTFFHDAPFGRNISVILDTPVPNFQNRGQTRAIIFPELSLQIIIYTPFPTIGR